MPPKDAVVITIDQSSDGTHFNFTYAPTTLHRVRGDKVAFQIVQGDAPARYVDLYFDHSPFANGDTYVRVEEGKPTVQTIGARGAYHYKAKGDVRIDREMRVAFDIWCPSIIVD